MENNVNVEKLDEAFTKYREHSNKGFELFMDRKAATIAGKDVLLRPEKPEKKFEKKQAATRGRKDRNRCFSVRIIISTRPRTLFIQFSSKVVSQNTAGPSGVITPRPVAAIAREKQTENIIYISDSD